MPLYGSGHAFLVLTMGRDPTNSSHWVLGLTRIDARRSFTTSAVSKSYEIIGFAAASRTFTWHRHVRSGRYSDLEIMSLCYAATSIRFGWLGFNILNPMYLPWPSSSRKKELSDKVVEGWTVWTGGLPAKSLEKHKEHCLELPQGACLQQKSWCWMRITAWKHWTLSLPEQINKREKACIKEIISSFETLPNHRKPCCRSFRGET